MKAELFFGLTKLEEISLSGNICIDDDFDENNLEDLFQAVAEKCEFCEDKNPTEMKICQTTNLIQKNAGRNIKKVIENSALQAKTLETFMNKTMTENIKNLVTIASLQAELSAVKLENASLKKNCKN